MDVASMNPTLIARFLSDASAVTQVGAGSHLSDDDVIDFLRDALAPGDLQRVTAHIDRCVECCSELEYFAERPELMRLAQDTGIETENSNVFEVLSANGVIEEGCDYVLPSGHHSGIFINLATLCGSDELTSWLVHALDRLTAKVQFDVIVAHGWPMAFIGRRLAALRRSAERTVEVVLAEGYPPTLVDELPTDGRALLLTDVCVSGRLLRSLERITTAAGLRPLAAASVVVGENTIDVPVNLLHLCRIPMGLAQADSCDRCSRLKVMEFNPFSYQMTVRKAEASSPGGFLDAHPEAYELWSLVDRARAYMHHRVRHDVHYTAFIDTAKLLKPAGVRRTLMTNFCSMLAPVEPDVLLVPDREPARTLGHALQLALTAQLRREPRLIYCDKRGSTDALATLKGATVVVLDAAAGHGLTIDGLLDRVQRAGPRAVAAAVLISRLKESHERALAARCSAGFHRLFHVPIRPVSVRGSETSGCATCAFARHVERAALESLARPIVLLVDALNRHDHPFAADGLSDEVYEQGTLFEPFGRSLLMHCKRGTASGIALHAFYAGQTNGMAPFRVPEVLQDDIPAASRISILDNLPAGAITVGGQRALDEIVKGLTPDQHPGVWLAIARALTREKSVLWFEKLDECLADVEFRAGSKPAHFWNWMATLLYLTLRENQPLRQEWHRRILTWREKYPESLSVEGIDSLVETLESMPV